jgi:hypothetical protein
MAPRNKDYIITIATIENRLGSTFNLLQPKIIGVISVTFSLELNASHNDRKNIQFLSL